MARLPDELSRFPREHLTPTTLVTLVRPLEADSCAGTGNLKAHVTDERTPMVHASPGRPRRRFYLTTIMLVLVAAFAAAGTALAASNSLRVKVTKKQLAFTGTAAAASDSVEVHFDPNKCATSYARETKRMKVAFTDFQVRRARHFTFTLKLPIPAPQGDKPGHHACAYLLHVSGASIKPVASASAKY
jgi:hypothetical protein